MAVPKKKRYKQIINSRRSLFIQSLLRDKNIKIEIFKKFQSKKYLKKIGSVKQNLPKDNLFTQHKAGDCGTFSLGVSKAMCPLCLQHFIKNM
jgi:hypothetical protein